MRHILKYIISIIFSILIFTNSYCENNSKITFFCSNKLLADILEFIAHNNSTNITTNITKNELDVKISTITCNSCIHHCTINKKNLKNLNEANVLIYLSDKYENIIAPFIKTENFKNRVDLSEIVSQDEKFFIENAYPSNKIFDFSKAKFNISTILEKYSQNKIHNLENFHLNLNNLEIAIKALFNILNLYDQNPVYHQNYQIILNKIQDIKEFIINNKIHIFVNDKELIPLAKFLNCPYKNQSTTIKAKKLVNYKCVLVSNHYNKISFETNLVIIPEYKSDILNYLDNLKKIITNCSEKF